MFYRFGQIPLAWIGFGVLKPRLIGVQCDSNDENDVASTDSSRHLKKFSEAHECMNRIYGGKSDFLKHFHSIQSKYKIK